MRHQISPILCVFAAPAPHIFLCIALLTLLLGVSPLASQAAEATHDVTASDGAEPSPEALGKALTAKYGKRRPVRWGEHMPGITKTLADTEIVKTATGTSGATASETDASRPNTPDPNAPQTTRTVALTLDACGGGTDMRIVALLRELQVPVTLFVTDRWVRGNKAVAQDIAQDPLFLFAAHGMRHKPASVNGRSAFGITGTATIAELVWEVETNARSIRALTGKRPAWFRTGTAYYDDVAVDVIRQLGLGIAGYTVSIDAGATLPAQEVARRMRTAPDNAILLGHINHPRSGTRQGLAESLPAMLKAGVRFVHLP